MTDARLNVMQLGRAIAEARAEYGIRHDVEYRQKDLAQALGVDASEVSRWERGVVIPRLKTVSMIERLLEMSVGSLVLAYHETKEARDAEREGATTEFALTYRGTHRLPKDLEERFRRMIEETTLEK